MRHILVAVDGSPGSRAAVAESVELAHETGADLTFLGVRHRIALLGRPYYQHKLSAQLARLRPALVEEILRAAMYRDADLVVVGSRGLGPIAGAVLGSVSKALVELSPTPVLVAKERAPRPAPAAG